MLTNQLKVLILQLDETINRQLDEILADETFQRLEAIWRGLHMLLQAKGNDTQIKIKLLDISLAELSKDLLNAMEFDQSQLFKKIYTNEFDQAGGEPMGLLIGDYYFSHQSSAEVRDSVAVLENLAKIAASAFCPMVVGASANLFGLNTFAEFTPHLQFQKYFQQKEYQRWQQLRSQEDLRFIGLALPKILLRLPYNHRVALEHRFYRQNTQGNKTHLFGNAAFAFAVVVIQAFKTSGWFADIRGIHPDKVSGGVLSNLVRDHFPLSEMNLHTSLATEVYFNDQQEKQLADLGLLPLCDVPLHDYAVFYSCQSLQSAKTYEKNSAQTNAKISSMLHYMLCISRFAHYLKVIMRDQIGSFISAEDCEAKLRHWILKYCAASENSSEASKAKYPLHQAEVKITAVPGISSKYVCTVHIKPHYQLDAVQSQLKIMTELGNLNA